MSFDDPFGHNPILILVGAYLLFEAASTALDGYLTHKTFRDPDASDKDKGTAIGSFVGGLEMPGPGNLWSGGLKKLTRGNFRENLARLTGREVRNADAHHVLPVAFEDIFRSKGFDIHDPRFGSWWESAAYRGKAYEYNEAWRGSFRGGDHSAGEILEFARALGRKYGFDVHF